MPHLGLWIVAGLIFGIAFLGFSMRSLELGASWEAVVAAELEHLGYAVLSSLSFMAVKAWRWSVIMAGFCRVPMATLMGAVYSGTAVNLLVSHVGELARASIVSRQHGVPTSSILASIGVERLFDLAAVLVLLGLFVATHGELPAALASAGYVATIIVATMIVGAIILLVWKEACLLAVRRVLSTLPGKLHESSLVWVERCVDGLRIVGSVRACIVLALLSLLQWMCIALGIWFSMLSVGATPAALAALPVLVLLVVGVTLPTAPAYLGTTQFGFTTGLALFQIHETQAFASSIVYTLFVTLPMLLIGLVCLYTQGMQVSALARMKSADPASP